MKRYHEDLESLHIGTEPPRGWFVPCSLKEEFSPYKWEKSTSVQLMNGQWNFRLCDSFDRALEFAALPASEQKWNTIAVPGCWQTQGFDANQYTNIRYPIPIDPPFVPNQNPTGVYETEFPVSEDQAKQRVYLNFDGVDSCFYLWINGEFVGYSQVSHCSSEFEITKYIRPGSNQARVIVLKWCDGTYLEDQDKLRMSGIFRDVYLLTRPQSHIRDFRINTRVDGQDAQLQVTLNYEGCAEGETCLRVLDAAGNLVTELPHAAAETVIDLKAPVLWNAEKPYLYRLEIEYAGEKIVKYFGVREVSIENAVLMVNHTPIKLKGVNRHDSDPRTGYTISREQLITDLRMMKAHNINAIRSSHYPNAPWAYDLYDKYGFYVICEADLEAHGNVFLYTREHFQIESPREKLDQLFFNHPLYGRMMNDPMFEKAVMDRIQRSVIREQNVTCRVMWSLGNESGFGSNLEKAAKWLKEFDPHTPVHYEGMIYQIPGREMDHSNIDVYSRMYPSPEVCEHYAQHQLLNKPFVCCEYMHSMGNGPGDIEDYWQVFYRYDTIAGGFAWEWCDHSVYSGEKNGKPMFLYGGDFGERQHDGNFCVDGLVTPDRKVKPGLLEYKNVLRPVRARLAQVQDGRAVVELTNCMDFSTIGTVIEVCCQIRENNALIREEVLDSLCIAPHQTECIGIDTHFGEKKSLKEVRLLYRRKDTSDWSDAGDVAGFEQLFIQRDYAFLQPCDLCARDGVQVEESDETITVFGSDPCFKYTFSKSAGQFTSMRFEEKEMLQKAGGWNIWRAPTDNDMYVKQEWQQAGYHLAQTKVYHADCSIQDHAAVITVAESISTPGYQKLLSLKTTWKIDANGTVKMSVSVHKNEDFPDLPRFGIRFFFTKDRENLKYWGIGPLESYPDKRRAGLEEFHAGKAADEYVDYIMPQEHGSHCGVRQLELSNGENEVVFDFAKAASTQVSVYSQEQLTQVGHNFDLHPEDCVIVCLDYNQNGIGSNSCGPVLNRKYAFDELEWDFGVVISVRKGRLSC